MHIFVLKFPGMKKAFFYPKSFQGIFFPVLLIGVHVFRVCLVWVEKQGAVRASLLRDDLSLGVLAP